MHLRLLLILVLYREELGTQTKVLNNYAHSQQELDF